MNSNEFRNSMSLLAAAVNVITTDGPAGKAGITASAVCSVTDSPPTVLVCINQQSSFHDKAQNNRRVCINILAGHHEDIAMTFAGQTGLSHDERFIPELWHTGNDGVPVLNEATASLTGEISDIKQSGSHSVFFITLNHIQFSQQTSGLAWFGRRFHTLA